MDYFKPLRRKLGVIILAIACACVAAWLRSESRIDHIWISLNNVVCWSFSGGQSLRLMTQFRNKTLNPPDKDEPMFHWDTITIKQLRGGKFHNERPILDQSAEIVNRWPFQRTSCWETAGFRFEKFARTDFGNAGTGFVSISVPYWSVLATLTALSGWLLLSKPREKSAITRMRETN